MIACCCLLTIVSCGSNHHSQPLALLTADSLFTEHPDSALRLLAEIAAETETWPREYRMRYYLLRNRAEEKCHILHDNDSAMQEAVRYFDKHGSSQERALAWFQLGRVYDEMQLTGMPSMPIIIHWPPTRYRPTVPSFLSGHALSIRSGK